MSTDPDLVEAADELDIEPQELEAILSDVQSVLEHLAGMDIDLEDPADLEKVRTNLPTERHRAQFLAAAMPTPLRDALEYVRPSERQSGYWRRSRERSDPSALSDAELRRNLAMHEAGETIRGTTGTVETDDGREIPTSAAKIREEMAGRSFQDKDDHGPQSSESGLAILKRMLR